MLKPDLFEEVPKIALVFPIPIKLDGACLIEPLPNIIDFSDPDIIIPPLKITDSLESKIIPLPAPTDPLD